MGGWWESDLLGYFPDSAHMSEYKNMQIKKLVGEPRNIWMNLVEKNIKRTVGTEELQENCLGVEISIAEDEGPIS